MTRRSKRQQTESISWNTVTDEQLLDMRFCDLKLSMEGSWVAPHVKTLKEELHSRGFVFSPHFWFSDEWFSPDGVPGVAIPFYLFNRRLMQLEKRQMLQIEGGTSESCLRILRHETGHALDSAYRIRYRKKFREVFGPPSAPYPESYRPRANSKHFVLHLDDWYAQAHPLEDFAETFAVWLRPRSRWRSRYEHWPALRKLLFIDEIMEKIRSLAPRVSSKEQTDLITRNRSTLRAYYEKRKELYAREWPPFYDRHLRRIFPERERRDSFMSAATFIRKNRTKLREGVSLWTGTSPYTIDQFIREVKERCSELELQVTDSPESTFQNLLLMLTIQTMNFIHSGHYRISL